MTTISRSDQRRYARLAGTLADEIQSGKYTPGKRLPSIHGLCQETGLSRQTIGKALRLLEGEGLIERVARPGVFRPRGLLISLDCAVEECDAGRSCPECAEDG